MCMRYDGWETCNHTYAVWILGRSALYDIAAFEMKAISASLTANEYSIAMSLNGRDLYNGSSASCEEAQERQTPRS